MAVLTLGIGKRNPINQAVSEVLLIDGRPIIQQGSDFFIPLDSVMFAAYYNPDREFVYSFGVQDGGSGVRKVEVTISWCSDDWLHIKTSEGKVFGLSCARAWAAEHVPKLWVTPNVARRYRYARELVQRANEEVRFTEEDSEGE